MHESKKDNAESPPPGERGRLDSFIVPPSAVLMGREVGTVFKNSTTDGITYVLRVQG